MAIARGTADELKAQVGGERVELVVTDPDRMGEAQAVLARHAVGEVERRPATRTLLAQVDGGVDVLAAVLGELRRLSLGVAEVGLRRPTLDDVFLTLTGHVAEPDTAAPDPDGDATDDRLEVPA